jgi:exopolysaccharide biosynthesis polyprenyl glycosylphosphotransferase
MRPYGETVPQVSGTVPAQPHAVPDRLRAGHPGGRRVRYVQAAAVGDTAAAAVPVYAAFRWTGSTHAEVHAAVAAGAWLLVRAVRDRYREHGFGGCGFLGPALRDWLALIGLLAVVRAATGEESPFPLALAALVPCAPASALARILLHRRLVGRRRDGRTVRRALVVGEAAAVDVLTDRLAARTDHDFAVAGVCQVGDESPCGQTPVAARLTGQAPPLPSADTGPVLDAVRRLGVDVVLVVPGPRLTGTRLRRLSWALHGEECPLLLVPGLAEVARHRVGVRCAAGLTLLDVAPPLGRGAPALLKSVTDRLGAALLIVLLAPVFAAVALVVRLDSPGPVVHRQIRIGRDGKPFTMAKFRTMVADAEQLRRRLAGANEQDGRMFKIRRDPRVTRAGRVLRRYSLDELPQLFNVMCGHMSLVGPRPPLPHEAAGYDEVERRRLAVKPGLTGLWQISGRSDLSWDETVALDLGYVDNWSPTVDLGVLCRTVGAVVTGRGAY